MSAHPSQRPSSRDTAAVAGTTRSDTAASRGDTAKRSGQENDRQITRSVKGEKKVVIKIPGLAGKGYPKPVEKAVTQSTQKKGSDTAKSGAKPREI